MVFEYETTIFYVTLWTLGFFAATLRILRDRDYRNGWDVLAVGGTGGIFAFGVVCILLRYDPPSDGNGFFYLGISALVGLLGKEQDLYLKMILRKVLKTIGVGDDPK